MKKAFTLIELIVVIIIIGVLATLGMSQYSRVIERARGAEIKQVLGQVRIPAIAYQMQYGRFTGIEEPFVGIGNGPDQIPMYPQCRSSHYFCYTIGGLGQTSWRLAVIRCNINGKPPQYTRAGVGIAIIRNENSGTEQIVPNRPEARMWY